MEDLTAEEVCGEEASQQSSALQEGDIVCFKMAHGEIVTRIGKMIYGVVAADVSQSALYGTCILQDETVFTCSCEQLWVAKHRMDDANIRMKYPKSKLNLVHSSLMSDPKKLLYDIQLSELQYKYDNGMRSPTGSDSVYKREDGFPEEDTRDEDAGGDEEPTDEFNAIRDEHKDTAQTLLALTMGSSSKSNLAFDDPVVANLQQEMQEMRTLIIYRQNPTLNTWFMSTMF